MINSEFPETCRANEYDWSDVTEPLTKEQLDKWLVALRTKDYTKGNGNLKQTINDETCHCVLGVLGEEEGKLSITDEYQRADKHIFRYSFIDHYGYESELGHTSGYYYMPRNMQQDIYSLNDDTFREASFSELADEIERWFQ